MEAESDFNQSAKSDMRACQLTNDLHTEPRINNAAQFYLAQTLPREMDMTPATTDRDFKASVEQSASSTATSALNQVYVNNNLGNFGHSSNIYIAGQSEREGMEADLFQRRLDQLLVNFRSETM